MEEEVKTDAAPAEAVPAAPAEATTAPATTPEEEAKKAEETIAAAKVLLKNLAEALWTKFAAKHPVLAYWVAGIGTALGAGAVALYYYLNTTAIIQ